MIGFVVVSHSARLAEGVCELAAQVGQGRVALAPAGGTGDPDNPLGTDAFRVREAIDAVFSPEGVLVFMDLGSAVLSAETALELLDPEQREQVRLCHVPLVEGIVAAVSQAAAGAGIEEILRGGEAPAASSGPAVEQVVALPNRLGLHARPAARLVRLARRFDARLTLENLSRPAAPAPAESLQGVLALGARQGHSLRIRAEGPESGPALAEAAAFLVSGCGDRETAAAPAASTVSAPAGQGVLAGMAGSAGIAVGPLIRLHAAAVPVAVREVEDPAAEAARLESALQGAQQETRALYRLAKERAGEDEAGIFDAQSLFLEDPALAGEARRMVLESRRDAASAWQAAAAEFASRLAALDDPYLAARAADVTDASLRVLRLLTGAATTAVALSAPSIVAARDLTPSEVQALDPALALGVCLETGSLSAHSVILARAMGIPCVVGLGQSLAAVPEGTTVALDGSRGLVWTSPGADRMAELETARQSWLHSRREALEARSRPAVTRDGRRIRVLANISGVADAAEALDYGAEGVGVLRTEFLFLRRAEAPGEDEQFAAYRAIAETMGSRPLVIRTLDAGGDKSLPYIDTGVEANPFLGWRGIRLTLERRDLLRIQLRAILRAAAGTAIEVLLPMISSLAELREAKALVAESAAELGVPPVKTGVMIEVPAAVAIADQLAAEAAFFSIGTNDLAQYLMAADRTNARVSAAADPLQPAVLRAVAHAVRAAREAGIGATLCGELAADPLAAPLLIGLGLEEFSASAPLIPEIKRAVSRVSAAEAGAVAREALRLDSAEAVKRMLREI